MISGNNFEKQYSIEVSGRWVTHTVGDIIFGSAGDSCFNNSFIGHLCNGNIEICSNSIVDFLHSQNTHYAFILVTPQTIFAATDQVRSIPVYYYYENSLFHISNSARTLRSITDTREVHLESLEEYLLSGYVHQDRTLYKSLMTVSAGQLLEFDRQHSKLSINQYFAYLPSNPKCSAIDSAIHDFGTTLDEIFSELVTSINDRPVWVPLSGGLDSRLVLCKLIEHGCKHVTAFTYGNKFSHEMKMARHISELLCVHWLGLPSTPGNLTTLYRSSIRNEYADYSDGLHMTPVLLDFEGLYKIKKRSLVDSDTIIINGYSGDFLFGGHIPETLAFSPSLNNITKHLVDKNCSHISTPNIKGPKARVFENILTQLSDLNCDTSAATLSCSLYEHWDWKERQSKAVVNGQRLYEFFNLGWRLPFWDKRLLSFWSSVPVHLKINQLLHLRYLKQYNYRGAFSSLRSTNQIWPRWSRWIPYAGLPIQLVGNRKHKENFYEYMFYHSYFNYQLRLFGRREYNNVFQYTRRPRVIPLAAINRLKELGIDPARYLKQQKTIGTK